VTELEHVARRAWHAWGGYQKDTVCAGCGGYCRCHARRARGPFLCLECFDLSDEGARAVAGMLARADA
jgi:hypothetical protein